MLDQTKQDDASADRHDDGAYKTISGIVDSGLVLICDHASNALPDRYGTLGLEADQLERHIAFDIGVEQVTVRLAKALNAPAVLAGFSRLLIDPNRGLDDPTLVMKLSDGDVIPGNRLADAEEINHRKQEYYQPYHDAIDRQIDLAINLGRPPVILSVHSFTPVWRGSKRPWHGAVLWDKDPRFVQPLIAGLEALGDLVIGDNEPYSGVLKNDCLYQHGTKRGLAHALLEIRQDLISDTNGIADWVGRLKQIVPQIISETSDLNKIQHFGSYAD